MNTYNQGQGLGDTDHLWAKGFNSPEANGRQARP